MDHLDTHSTVDRKIIDFRPLGIQGAFVLGRYHYTKAHPGLPIHRHERMLEICYLAKGQQSYRVGSEVYKLSGGDVFLTFPDELHGTGQAPEERGDLYWLIVDMVPVRNGFLGCEAVEGRRLQESLLAIRTRQFKGIPALKGILDDVFAIFGNQDRAFRKIAIATSLIRFLLAVLECSRCSRRRIGVSPEIVAIQSYIEACLTDDTDLHLTQLAGRCSMSLSCFKARFRQETGLPPAEYVLRRKIDKSISMLWDGHRVTDVAHNLGFSSSQHFATVFRRFVGQSPRAYLGEKPPIVQTPDV